MNCIEIKQIVSEYLDVSLEQMESRCRRGSFVQARYVAYYFCRKYTTASLAMIGEHIGGKDHSTVLFGANSITNQCEQYPKFALMIHDIESRILNYQAGIKGDMDTFMENDCFPAEKPQIEIKSKKRQFKEIKSPVVELHPLKNFVNPYASHEYHSHIFTANTCPR